MGENQEKTSEKNLKETQKGKAQPVLPVSTKKMGEKVVQKALKNTKILGAGLPPWEEKKELKQKSKALKNTKILDDDIPPWEEEKELKDIPKKQKSTEKKLTQPSEVLKPKKPQQQKHLDDDIPPEM
jgi:hypothetical protein